MIAFIQDHRGQHGVEPMCRVLQIAPSTFYEHQTIAVDPSLASDRAKRDDELRPEVLRIWQENRSVYGARKLWHAMKREQLISPAARLSGSCVILALKAFGAERMEKQPMDSLLRFAR